MARVGVVATCLNPEQLGSDLCDERTRDRLKRLPQTALRIADRRKVLGDELDAIEGRKRRLRRGADKGEVRGHDREVGRHRGRGRLGVCTVHDPVRTGKGVRGWVGYGGNPHGVGLKRLRKLTYRVPGDKWVHWLRQGVEIAAQPPGALR